ncbi:4-coumarate-CoA ligase 1 [Smittium culicis]|uniref:4-coumarate-CoA ligase 1 n=1 Tax=Smittium culicis TaxID=133412 RepID=A0A1R1YGQ8_9FUNG|nr:4-coumarate-CoA ligase 1 [Smittium culicis]
MIFKSKTATVDIPNIDIATYCLEEGKKSSRKYDNNAGYAIRDGETKRSFTIHELESQSIAFGSGLVNEFGFKRDNVLAVFSQNSIYYPVAIFGTIMTGGIVTLANPTYNARELAHQLRDSGASIIATQTAFLQITKDAIKLGNIGIPDSKILLMDAIKNPSDKHRHISDVYSNLTFKRFKIKDEYEADNKISILSYSSGTTGLAKGVVLTNKNIVTTALVNSNFLNADGDHDRSSLPPIYLSMLPFYHIYGLVLNLFIGMMNSVGLVILPKFEMKRFFELVQDEKITFAHIVPPVIISLLNEPNVGRYDLSSLKFLMTGAAPLGKDVLTRFIEKFNGVKIIRSYGLTEASPTICLSYKDHPFDGSSGVLLGNIEAKVIDESGKKLGVGEVGELCFRGSNMTKQYLNNVKATKASIDDEGFFHTGDVGYIDENTNLFIVDRIKELIKYKGFQVAPAELESLLLLHEDVADSAVVGIYREELGTELPKAYITLAGSNNTKLPKDQIKCKVDAILAWINNQVAPHKKLRGGIEVLEIIPKSASGKILRRELREMEKRKLELLQKIPKL